MLASLAFQQVGFEVLLVLRGHMSCISDLGVLRFGFWLEGFVSLKLFHELGGV